VVDMRDDREIADIGDRVGGHGPRDSRGVRAGEGRGRGSLRTGPAFQLDRYSWRGDLAARISCFGLAGTSASRAW
jgi:hypothetical protein